MRILDPATKTTNDPSGWIRFDDIRRLEEWHWEWVHSSDDENQIVEFTLKAGTYTLEIARYEAVTHLNAIALIQ